MWEFYSPDLFRMASLFLLLVVVLVLVLFLNLCLSLSISPWMSGLKWRMILSSIVVLVQIRSNTTSRDDRDNDEQKNRKRMRRTVVNCSVKYFGRLSTNSFPIIIIQIIISNLSAIFPINSIWKLSYLFPALFSPTFGLVRTRGVVKYMQKGW